MIDELMRAQPALIILFSTVLGASGCGAKLNSGDGSGALEGGSAAAGSMMMTTMTGGHRGIHDVQSAGEVHFPAKHVAQLRLGPSRGELGSGLRGRHPRLRAATGQLLQRISGA